MRRLNLFLALLLVVGLVVYVDLVKVPQAPQIQPVSANDLIGIWRSDGEVEWNNILHRSRSISETFNHLQSTDPKAAELYKFNNMARYRAVTVYQITADKLITWEGRVPYEMSYANTAASGNKLITDLIDNEGNAFAVAFTITGDRLEAFPCPPARKLGSILQARALAGAPDDPRALSVLDQFVRLLLRRWS